MQSALTRQSLLVAAAGVFIGVAALAQDTQPPAQEQELPEASALFNKCFEAMATPEVLESINSATWTVVPPATLGNATIKAHALAPDKFRVDASIEGSDALIVISGEHMWAQGPGQPIEYGGDQETNLVSILFGPQFLIHSAQTRFTATTSGTEQIGEDECYQVDLAKGEEETGISLFFNQESGLCTGLRTPDDAGDGVTVTFTEWGEVEGFKVITKAVAVSDAEQMPPLEFEYKDFVFNKVDGKLFEMPEEVKKLAEEAKQGAGDGGDDTIRE